MRHLLSLVCVIGLSVAPALAGDGHVTRQSLSKMGLSGMQVMTDDQGMQIRGTSIAVAAGGSIATIHGVGGSASSTNTYYAAGSHSASGSNVSFAADGTTTSVTSHGHTTTVTTVNFVAAGGASSAKAH
jgi:hypothetical protein